ncbi:DUF6348 family protein [Amycolatopsis sp. lyj-112]|uniref:DUF6348 family protein n=1 Tax=Amycolatopsis sp. lyj-112 TaxID=2789288 RepID=UPI00397D1059
MIESVKLDAAVEVGIAAFCAGEEPPSDDQVWERLTGTGVEPWLAERLLVFLPMAYTQRLLPAASYPDGVVAPGGRLKLSDEPVFVAAFDRAQHGHRGEFERIAVRSSTFGVINEAMKDGVELPDIVLGEAALIKDLEPVEQGDGGVPSPQAVFEDLLREHGTSLDGEAKAEAKLVVHPAPAGAVIVQVDFALSHPGLAKPWLVESFAGYGATWREAIGQAVTVFLGGALHPIIDGLLRPGTASDQVERERYEHPDGVFHLLLGAQINLFLEHAPSVSPLLDSLLESLRAEPLVQKAHALRLFVAYENGRLQTNEVLLNSEPWPRGEAVIAEHQAPLPEEKVAMRVFGLLVPAPA